MRRPLVLSLTVAVLSGLCAVGTAQAAPVASTAPATAEPPSVPGELLVGYVKGATASDRDRARGRAGAERRERVVAAAADRTEVELVRLPAGKSRAQAEKELETDPAVAYAEPNWIYQHQSATDPLFADGSLWGLKSDTATATITSGESANTHGSWASKAWAEGATGSAEIYVGVIDEGIQLQHPDLTGQVWSNPEDPIGDALNDGKPDDDGNGYVDDVNGWDFVNNDNTIYDGGVKGNADDHGTHVSGTIGAKANNGVGVAGVNWDVRLISGKFLGRSGGSLANAVKAVDYFTALKKDQGLNIVATNNSWGGGGFSQALLDAIVRGAKADILFIAAAGNSSSDNDVTASYPSNYDTTKTTSTDHPAAEYDAVIAVAATTSSGGLADFSQYGATTVDLGAPGDGIWSTTAPGTYESYRGTSMATPHVTGAAALYAAAMSPRPTARAIKAALLDTAVATPSLAGKTLTGGRLNVYNALKGITRPVEATPPSSDAPARSFDVFIKSRQRNTTTVGLSWSGYAGANVSVTHNSGSYETGNDGSHEQNWRGSGTVTYTLCETDKTTGCITQSVTI